MKNITRCLVLFAAASAVVPGVVPAEQDPEIKIAFDRLRVKELSVATPEDSRAMGTVGATKTVAAADALIDALAFNYEPYLTTDEAQSVTDMIPAISFLRIHYGDSILPLLFVRGIEATEPWMRERCALAAQSVASEGAIENMISIFSMDSGSESAQSFGRLLRTDNLEVELYSPKAVATEKLREALIEALKKKRKEDPNGDSN